MQTLKVKLENCYGIKKLKTDLDFSQTRAIAVYAPNGAMKTSLAQTFRDLREGTDSSDRIFPERKTSRQITDEKNKTLAPDNIFVISPYDQEYAHTEKTSTLLVDSKLRKEYDQLLQQVESSKETFLRNIKRQCGSKKDLEAEISSAFTKTDKEFFLDFIFEDGNDKAPVQKDALLRVLSMGEKKAFYVLNIIFEVEVRKRANQETLFLIDDVADSFDYKNKYAIIEYLKDISEQPYFKQLILTHNFDFFRTICGRFVGYPNCMMASKSDTEVRLNQATGINNPFVKDWKPNFCKDPKKKIASIPFLRNMVEFTKGDRDLDFVKLTSLLHWKTDSAAITQGDLDGIFNSMFNCNEKSANPGKKVMDVIEECANDCLKAGEGINFENKIVLSIAIRIAAEKFMIGKIKDDPFVASITANQTSELFNKFKQKFGENGGSKTLSRVLLMTPESIHLNSFMYEPILDMSDNHLRTLLTQVRGLK